jgi:hypothetical protein
MSSKRRATMLGATPITCGPWTGRLRARALLATGVRSGASSSSSLLPLASSLLMGASNPFKLCTLSPELISLVLEQLDECVALVRLSQTCKTLRQASRADALWRPVLSAFFDGTLPPIDILLRSHAGHHRGGGRNDEVGASVGGGGDGCSGSGDKSIGGYHSLDVLREQVSYARRLTAREIQMRLFIVPRERAGWHALSRRRAAAPTSSDRADAHEAANNHAMSEEEEVAPGFLRWRAEMDASLRDVSSSSHTRRGSGGVPRYSLTLTFFASLVRVSCVCEEALRRGADLTSKAREAATFTHWMRRAEEPESIEPISLLDQARSYAYDYGLLCEFKDQKLAELAERFLGDASKENSRIVRRRLEGHYESTGRVVDARDARARARPSSCSCSSSTTTTPVLSLAPSSIH